MIGKKRGMLVVVVLVILLSFSGLAVWDAHCPEGQCAAITIGVDSTPEGDLDSDASGYRDFSCNEYGGICRSVSAVSQIVPKMDDDGDEADCRFTPAIVPGQCYVAVGDEDDGDNYD